MSFVTRLRSELIRVSPPWRTFGDTITGLAGTLEAAGLLRAGSRDQAVDAVTAREADGSTALLDIHAGVPHARLAGIGRPLVALALSPDGLYEAVPTVPIQIVALVLSPPDSGAQHLNILSGIATLLRSADLRAALLIARDGADALAALRRHARSMPR
jgi:mannitol/fructose-specific phosphotransferase system IIA component (Ntr-type)